MADTIDFAAVGKALQQQYPQYSKSNPETLGQLYVKKYRPADYDAYIKQQSAQTSLGESVAKEQATRAIDYSPEAIQQEVNKTVAIEQAKNIETNKQSDIQAKKKAEQTSRDQANKGKKILDQLLGNYFKGGQDTGLAYGRVEGVNQTLKQKMGANPQLNTYEGILATSRPTLARAFGDVGNLSQTEQEAAIKNLPNQFSTPEEAFTAWKEAYKRFGLTPPNRLLEIEKNYYAKTNGNQSQQQSVIPSDIQGNNQETNQGIPAINVNVNGKSINPALTFLGDTAKQALYATPGFGQALGNLRSPVGRLLAGGPNKIIDKSLKGQAPSKGDVVESGIDLAGLLLGAGAIRTAAKFGVGQVAARTAVVNQLEKDGIKLGATPEVQSIAKKMIADNLAGPKYQPIVKELAKGKGTSPKKLVDLLVRSGQKTFTKGGDQRLADQSEYYDLMREAIRNDLKSSAPKIIEKTSNIARGYKAKGAIKKAAVIGGTGAAGLASLSYLASQLRGKE